MPHWDYALPRKGFWLNFWYHIHVLREYLDCNCIISVPLLHEWEFLTWPFSFVVCRVHSGEKQVISPSCLYHTSLELWKLDKWIKLQTQFELYLCRTTKVCGVFTSGGEPRRLAGVKIVLEKSRTSLSKNFRGIPCLAMVTCLMTHYSKEYNYLSMQVSLMFA